MRPRHLPCIVLHRRMAFGAASACCGHAPSQLPTDKLPAAYTNTKQFLTFVAPRHSSRYDLLLSSGRYGGDYPDCISLNGTRVKELGAIGSVHVDPDSGTGYVEVSFNGTLAPESERGAMSGEWKIRPAGFIPTVPFTRNGISQNIIQHGCSQQGEPGFPQLKS